MNYQGIGTDLIGDTSQCSSHVKHNHISIYSFDGYVKWTSWIPIQGTKSNRIA